MSFNVDTCVCCGAVVPEGRMVCPECESKGKFLFFKNFHLHEQTKYSPKGE